MKSDGSEDIKYILSAIFLTVSVLNWDLSRQILE